MRIRRIRIGSFGGVRDRDYSLDGGLTVMHGPNESGKTTVMEFVRAVLVPSGRRDVYPARARTDSGALDVEDGGEARRLELSYREVSGGRPACVEGMDYGLYSSVFAMTPADLDSDAVITKGEVKTRFLTVPGGEAMPRVLKDLDNGERSVVGLRSNSRSELLAASAELDGLERSVSARRAEASRYGEKAEEARALEARMAGLRESSRAAEEARAASRVREGARGTYERLGALRAERSALGEFEPVSQSDVEERARLQSRLDEARRREAAALDAAERRLERMDGVDPDAVNADGRAIDALPGRLEACRRGSERLARAEAEAAPAPAGGPRRRSRALLAAGAALVAAGLVLALALTPYALAIAAAGAVAAALGIRGRPGALASPGISEAAASAIRSDAESLERDLRSICSRTGVPYTTPDDTVSRLTGYRRTAAGLSDDTSCADARADRLEADLELTGFLARFSGAGGFEASLSKTESAREIDAGIAAAEGAIRSAGMDPAAPWEPAEEPEDGSPAELEAAAARLGELQAEMRAILDMEDLEEDIDRLSGLRARYEALLVRGAEILLASHIASEACRRAYGEVQPAVVTAANGVFREMTGGGFSIEVDPTTSDVRVASPDGSRPMEMWSSGLRAQVLLSLKLAIAMEMGGGEVPVLLDDALLPFDSERKAGAVRALAALSGRMQVVLFTCDAETRSIAASLPGVQVLEMARKPIPVA